MDPQFQTDIKSNCRCPNYFSIKTYLKI